jgi:hypothetical protein
LLLPRTTAPAYGEPLALYEPMPVAYEFDRGVGGIPAVEEPHVVAGGLTKHRQRGLAK